MDTYSDWGRRQRYDSLFNRTPPQRANVEMPPGIPLDELDAGHPAVNDLRKRGFDAAQLARDYDLTYCEGYSSSRPAIIVPSIVIPVYRTNVVYVPMKREIYVKRHLVGWQARAIGSGLSEGEPEYVNALATAQTKVLYRQPVAAPDTGAMVVVESAADAWRVGVRGLALLGRTISGSQAMSLIRGFAGYPIVVWLDSQADVINVRNYIAIAKDIHGDRAPVRMATTPPGRKGPRDCTPDEVDAVIRDALRGEA